MAGDGEAVDRPVQRDRGHLDRAGEPGAQGGGTGDGLADQGLELGEVGDGEAQLAAERAIGNTIARLALEAGARAREHQVLDRDRAGGLDERLGLQGRAGADQLLRARWQAGQAGGAAVEGYLDPFGALAQSDVGSERDRAGQWQVRRPGPASRP